MTSRRSTGTSALRTAVLPPQKKGPKGRQNEEGKGNKVDGSGRWRGYSAGSIPGVGVPGGSQTPRENDRHGSGSFQETRSPSEKAKANHRRPSVRQQSTARSAQQAQHRTHRASEKEQQASQGAGRTKTPSVQ